MLPETEADIASHSPNERFDRAQPNHTSLYKVMLTAMASIISVVWSFAAGLALFGHHTKENCAYQDAEFGRRRSWLCDRSVKR
jgi:hypothetical protein